VQHLIDSYQPFIVHSRPVNPDLITSHPNLLIYSAKRQTKYCPRHLLLLHHVHCTTLLSLHVKTMLRQICLVTVPPVGQQITVITMSVCLCVCVFARKHISRTRGPIVTKFCMLVAMARSSGGVVI